jgi:hypothetical protein
MTVTINKTVEDILYVGTDFEIAQRIKEKFPTKSFRQVDNYEELKDGLVRAMTVFQIGRSCGASGYQLTKGLYPVVTLITPDFPESQGSEKTVPYGPGIVCEARKCLRFLETYVLANDEAYAQDKKSLKSFCEKENIPVILESELESRFEEILKE